MTSMLRFPYRSDFCEHLDISYNYFNGHMLDEMLRNHMKCEEMWLKVPQPWQKIWYYRFVHVLGVKKPERMANPRMRFFCSLVDKIR